MRCDECKWWDLIESDKDERSDLEAQLDKLESKAERDGIATRTVDEWTNWFECNNILNAGYCIRYPPSLKLAEEKDEIYEWYGNFPKTQFSWLCGEFARKEM